MAHEKRSVILKRSSKRKRQLRKILIVCEGKKTEPLYFKSFPEKPDVFDSLDVEGVGNNTIFVVKKAIELRDKALKEGNPYIETWAVFDKDDFSQKDFEFAISTAVENKIHVAYSIECFELWYLLHFNYYDTAINRSDYYDKLSILLKQKYEKNNENMYSLLKTRIDTAIKNASKLHVRQMLFPLDEQNPITLVYELVQKLR
ncbi:MAG: RloB domain-containing protein [Treponema sp.]|nr:RloB domain-containing protein [Treponema sp.]